MTEIKKNKQYDLEERTFSFARRIADYVNKLSRSITNIEIGKQLFRSASSIGANYIEANESLGKKDFSMRIRISRKEAKETRYWVNLSEPQKEQLKEKELLFKEATELMNIFGAILKKVK